MNNQNTLIEKIIIEQIRPYIISHQGDIVFREYKDGIVYVTLSGSCVGCPFSAMTLQLGVLEMLQQEIPEITAVELVE